MSKLPAGTVTLLFTDIEGSTRLLQQLGEGYASVLSECRDLLRAAFHEHRGHEVDTQGDSFFVAFARASDALSAAVAAQHALATHPWPEGVALRVRMGLHTGEPSLVSADYIGLDVHHAARIMSAAHGGQVLLSQTTRDLVQYDLPDGVSLRDLGEHHLKDLQRPSRLFQIMIADLPAEFPPLKTLDNRPNNLPVQFTPLIGREQEVAAVQNLLLREEVRLVTLTGPGGTGKTRLGLQVATELIDTFADGVCFVSLAPLSDPELVLPTLTQALRLPEARGRSPLEHLQASLQDKHLLLLLDNFEQVASAAVMLVALLQTCPDLKAMVTSRALLHVRGEYEVQVSPLDLPEPNQFADVELLTRNAAVTLFTQRAQALAPDFALTGTNAHVIAALCTHLDGLPLAIELAAARIKLLSPQQLLRRLEHRLDVLTSGAQDLPVRQQTLRATLQWSYELLSPREQRLFRLLSVFVGGCMLEAVEAVCHALGDGATVVLDGVQRLLDNNLLFERKQSTGEARLMMLETIREYALERLAESGEAEAMRRQHATFFLRLSEEAEPKIRSAEQSTWRKRFEVEHDNLRAALRWTLESQEAEMGLQLAGALLAFWRVSNQDHEGRSWLEQVLAQPGTKARTAARAKALLAAGSMAYFQGDLPEAHRLLEESVSIGREVGTAGKRNLAHALTELARVALLQGNLSSARKLAEESVQLFREVGEAWGTALALNHLGTATLELGDPVAACPLLEESTALFRIVGDRQRLALPLNALGLVALRQGDYSGARAHFEKALAVARETEDEQYIADTLAHMGTVALRMGEYHESATLYQQSLAINREQGYKYGLIEDLAGLAEVASLLGQPEQAARLLGAVEALRETSNISLPPLRRAEYERTVESIRTQLDEATFAEAWKEGRTMPLEQVLANREAMPSPRPVLTAPPSTATAFAPPLHARLTPREMDVLRLLAQGLTSAQIAEQLIISLVTVNSHVRSIYSKLGVTSRSAATRYAFEHQLV